MANHYTYDAFVSFRGEDARYRFVSHLHNALARHRINTFKDNDSLERGESISPAIKTSIHKSRLSIIVFSKHYASSTWCLEELVEIMHCKENKGQIVLPVFHDVDPSEVSDQSGSFGEAFVEHERKLRFEKEGMQQIQSWRSCLTTAAEISGWDSQNNQDEAKLIEEIAADVMKKLTRISSAQSSELVGMDSRIEEISKRLDFAYDNVRMVGICGIRGIGKTTLARFIYNQFSGRFNGFCFLENVRENVQKYGLDYLKYQLVWKVQSGRITSGYVGLNPVMNVFRHESVLIVLDDVDNIEQLKELAGGHDWFGLGSRIIITTRDKDLLRAHGVYEIYDVERLNDFESLQLFNHHAFRNRDATDEFMNLAPIIVNHARGLPLVVKVLGSSLFDKSLFEWENNLADLNRNNWEVPELLRNCFDKLNAVQKKIFLDIACFFEGYDADYVAKCLDVYGISTEAGVKALCDKCFLSVSDKRIWIHDLLQEMAQEVVRQQSNEAATCSRLWDSEDANHVLSANKGIEKVEVMILDSSKINDVLSLPSIISEMSNLRLLKIYSSTNRGNTLQVPHCRLKSNFIRFCTSFSNDLICFQWEGYPLMYLPYDFHPQNLIELYMPYSNLKKFSTNMKCFDKLKFINLSYSTNLIETPDFSETPNLEKLNLEGCTNLTKVHSSIASHKSLQLVNMKDCTSFCKFPSPIEMKALKFFILSGCSKLQEFPEIRGNMECLLELHVDGTAIKRLPGSSRELNGLEVLCVEDSQDLNILAAVGCSSKLKIIKVISGRRVESYWSKWGLNRYAAAAAMIGVVLL